MIERVFFYACLFCSCLIAACGGQGGAADPRPSVILITVDALRADHLGCYGYKRDTSPYIDRLAAGGVFFSQAVAHSSHTPPSFATLATGRYVRIHGVRTWGGSIPGDVETLFEVFRSAGYETLFLTSHSGIVGGGLPGFERGIGRALIVEGRAEALTDRAIQFFIHEPRGAPFFLWIHYMDTHEPFVPQSPYDTLFVGDAFYDARKRLPIVHHSFEGMYGFHSIPAYFADECDQDHADQIDYYIAQYDGCVRSVDGQVARLLNFFTRARPSEQAFLVLTSDHGKLFGEHGYYLHHGAFLYEPLLRVPLIICGPLGNPRRAVVPAMVNAHLDLMPTLLDLCGIAKPQGLDGVSLAGLWRGHEIPAVPETFGDEGGSRVAVRTERWKLIYNFNNQETELFDLLNDPGETRDVKIQEPEVFISLKRRIDAYLSKGASRPQPVLQLREETQARLRSLGYLQ